ncbi:hypothetical protein M9H77_21409 [Catharanthus roseus]|uniref:Uncharacterized protein n=1 Tax=Catharanthus roseus TaxID=4058 RepID=A0ACC0ARI0_CATRO|nr:hypothetical protein M9H77_21409 [Catharanthus roseus]
MDLIVVEKVAQKRHVGSGLDQLLQEHSSINRSTRKIRNPFYFKWTFQKQRISRSKKHIRKNIWKRKGYWTTTTPLPHASNQLAWFGLEHCNQSLYLSKRWIQSLGPCRKEKEFHALPFGKGALGKYY